MISKTKISKRIKRKTNSELVDTIMLAKKNNQVEIAGILSGPTRKIPSKNLEEIDKEAKEGETIIVPGKILGKGKIDKKIKIIALNFSKSAEAKLKKSKTEFKVIKNVLEKEKKIEGRLIR